MYAYLKGNIESILEDRIVMDVNNTGYNIYMPENELEKLRTSSGPIKINTYFQVREDNMKLFGFLSTETLSFFKKLISVSGVGAKVAIGIISNISPSDMCIAIATDDVMSLKKVPGIGPKTAQKIIFELKDKISKDELKDFKNKKVVAKKENINIKDARIALQVLGYNDKDILEVMSKLEIEEDTVENIIMKVLKEMQNL